MATIIGDRKFHPIIESCGASNALAALVAPVVESEAFDPTAISGTHIDFGTTGDNTKPYLPRGFRVLANGDLNFRVGGGYGGITPADETRTFTAGDEVKGELIFRITKNGSTTNSIKLLY